MTNKINGKVYVGFTTRTLERRMTVHFNESKKGSTTAFHKAIRKYGEDKFEWNVIYESDDPEHCLNVMEPYFIIERNSMGKHGYNMVSGGQRGPRLCGESNPMFGKTHTEEARIKIAENVGQRSRGKSYEEIYGAEKAAELKRIRAERATRARKEKPYNGSANPNFDHTEYEFVHTEGTMFRGTIFALRKHDPNLTIENTGRLKKGGTSKGWKQVL